MSKIISLETYRKTKRREARVPVLKQYRLPKVFGIKAAIAIVRKTTPAPVIIPTQPTVIRLLKPQYRQTEKVSPGDRTPCA